MGEYFPPAVSADRYDNAYITGTFTSPNLVFGSYTLYLWPFSENFGTPANAFFVKYDVAGNVQWARSGVQGTGYSVSADTSGHVYFSGGVGRYQIYDGVTITPAVATGDGSYYLKCDSDGNLLASAALICGGYDVNYLAADPFGGVYVTADFLDTTVIIGPDTLIKTSENDFTARLGFSNQVCNLVPINLQPGSIRICLVDSAMVCAQSGYASYAWNSGQTTQCIYANAFTEGIAGQAYYVTVTDNNNCSTTSGHLVVHILAAPYVTLSVPADSFCNRGAAVILTGSPAGGIYAGSGVTDSLFNPVIAGTGNDTLTYTCTGTDGCSATASQSVFVAYFPDSFTVESFQDTTGVVTFFVQPSGIGNCTWQTMNNDIHGINSFTGDTITIYCWEPGLRPVDTFQTSIVIRAVLSLRGCTDTSDWVYYNGCRIIGGGIKQINDDNDISLFPNPATDQLYIKTQNIQPLNITVYDADGRMIYIMPFKPALDVNQLSSGVYFIEVKSDEGVARKRFVKM